MHIYIEYILEINKTYLQKKKEKTCRGLFIHSCFAVFFVSLLFLFSLHLKESGCFADLDYQSEILSTNKIRFLNKDETAHQYAYIRSLKSDHINASMHQK